MLTPEENELLTRVGPETPMGRLMRRYWAPVLFSSELAEPDCPPRRVRVLGEDLVAFRDTSGRVGLLEQHCPHRGASLFFGRNEECGLRCVYHGWKFDVAGNCVDMPNEPAESNPSAPLRTSFKHKIKLTAYPCHEVGGIIWAYMGPAELEPGLPELEWIDVPDSHRFQTKHLQESNWLQGLEGGFDYSHIPFLHRGDIDPGSSERYWNGQFGIGRNDLAATDGGFVLGGARELGNGRTYWSVQQWLMPWYKGFSFLGYPPISAHAWVPVDDEHVMIWSVEYRPDRPLRDEEMARSRNWLYIHSEAVPGTDRPIRNKDNDYLIDRERQRSRQSFTGIRGIGVEDTAVQESMGPIYDRSSEHLGTADVPIIALRRGLLQALKDLEEGRTPPGLDPVSQRLQSVSIEIPSEQSFTDVGIEAMQAQAIERGELATV